MSFKPYVLIIPLVIMIVHTLYVMNTLWLENQSLIRECAIHLSDIFNTLLA